MSDLKASLTRTPKALGIVVLAGAALALSSCGGSSTASHSTATSAATATPVASAPSEAPASTSSSRAHRVAGVGGSSRGAGGATKIIAVSSGNAVKVKSPPDPESPIAVPKGPNPCSLISRTDAQTIISTPISSITEAPLGPTCIFNLQGSKQSITLAVEQLNVAGQVRLMRNVQHSTVGGHQAYCGTLGRPMLYIALSGSKVLNVTASCTVAEALAAKALPHIVA